ncbi:MAG: CHRD domain-containing protein [Gemmatimonadaceae bacterium]
MRTICLATSVTLIALTLQADRLHAQGDGVTTLTAALTGQAGAPAKGDPDGSGSASLEIDPAQGRVCFQLRVSGIGPARAAHVHRGGAGQSGPVVLALAPPTEGSVRECVNAGRGLLQEILRNPAGYYVNVHNAEFATGALRGQLGR